jgi:hypothetical protein
MTCPKCTNDDDRLIEQTRIVNGIVAHCVVCSHTWLIPD